jgi:hypothetical protein
METVRRILLRAHVDHSQSEGTDLSRFEGEWGLERLADQICEYLHSYTKRGADRVAEREGANDATATRDSAAGWKHACLLLAATNQALIYLVADLSWHKSILNAYSMYAAKTINNIHGRVDRTLRDEDPEFDRVYKPLPRLKVVVLAVIASQRFRKAVSPITRESRGHKSVLDGLGLAIHIRFQDIDPDAVFPDAASGELTALLNSQVISQGEKLPLLIRFLKQLGALASSNTRRSRPGIAAQIPMALRLQGQEKRLWSSLDYLCKLARGSSYLAGATSAHATPMKAFSLARPEVPNVEGFHSKILPETISRERSYRASSVESLPSYDPSVAFQDSAFGHENPATRGRSISSPSNLDLDRLKEEKMAAENELDRALFLLSQQLSPDRAQSPDRLL